MRHKSRFVIFAHNSTYYKLHQVADVVAKHDDDVMGLPAILSLTAGAETTLFI
ncbi:MAG: hypothetical protein ACREJU_00985 [Nitrospiraceae bacterium]